MKKHRTAGTILRGTGIGILDTVTIIRDIINNKDKSLSLNNYSYSKKIIELGKNHFTTAPQKTLFEVFLEYLEDKKHLKPDSLKDIKKLGNRIFRTNTNLKDRLISTLKHSELESILERTFCSRRDSNPYAVKHTNLNRACLPISPLEQILYLSIFNQHFYLVN